LKLSIEKANATITLMRCLGDPVRTAANGVKCSGRRGRNPGVKWERRLKRKCGVVKLEPVWTNEYLKQQQLKVPLLKTFIELKNSTKERPP